MAPAENNPVMESHFTRHERNPVLSRDRWPYPCNTIFNAGAVRLPDGTTLLLCRVEDQRGISHLTVARSADGVGDWRIDPKPTLMPDPVEHPEELWGIEDPRITFVPELDRYAVAYTAYSRAGPGVSLALTKDFVTFERIGFVMTPEDKDAALLPRRLKGHFALIHRPIVPGLGGHIWVSYSPDLIHWGRHRMILESRRGAWWDANKIGLAAPPIETPEGWLTIYHAVRSTAGGCLYRVGLALFDLEECSQCLRRGDYWIMGPDTPYEREGDVPNVIFPCGYTIANDGDTINLYYGAADTSICLAHGSIKKLLEWLMRHPNPTPHDPLSRWGRRVVEARG